MIPSPKRLLNVVWGVLLVAASITFVASSSPFWIAQAGETTAPASSVLPPPGWEAPDQLAAVKAARKVPTPVEEVWHEDFVLRQQRVRTTGLTTDDIEHTYLWLSSPLVNTYEDTYEPVRFMHAQHAAMLGGDCVTCHHYRPAAEGASETTACSACHRRGYDHEHPMRVGLKAAYHQQCIGCHEKMQAGPVGCEDCHRKKVPDHTKLVELPEKPSALEVTAECLRCHGDVGSDMLSTAHWLWRGPSRHTVEHESSIACGKCSEAINNYCLSPISNHARCTACHAGYGWKDPAFDFTDATKIDCLVCHDTTGSYRKSPTGAGFPDPDVDLLTAAQRVGRTSRRACGSCHFSGGGGDAVKHGDMSSSLNWPTRACDVHMGGYDFRCTECHTTRNHEISGRSTSVCVSEGPRACADCHTCTPHYGDSLLDHHLNRHCATVACNTCHTPLYAKCAPTKVWWDWSTAGDRDHPATVDRYGKPTYNWKKGTFQWQEAARPTYAWFNGYTQRLLLGDPIDPDAVGFAPDTTPSDEEKAAMAVTHITRPVGSIDDPTSRITPFKVMRGIQPADAVHRYLLVPHLYPYDENDDTAFWKGRDWQQAFREGMRQANLPYSGTYIWVRTDMYWRLEHEVMPADSALSCQHCHQSLRGNQTCDRCHQDRRDVDFRELCAKGVDFAELRSQGHDIAPDADTRRAIDFEALGYDGDPILHGGRFEQLPLRYQNGSRRDH